MKRNTLNQFAAHVLLVRRGMLQAMGEAASDSGE